MSRVGIQELHKLLDKALPVPMSEVTSETMKRLDARCWEPGLTSQEFRRRYLDACVLKRWQGESETISAADRKAAAYEKLLDSEIRCTETNRLFIGPESLSWSNARIPTHLIGVYKRARRILERLLGRFDWEEFPTCVDFTPGATTEFPRRSSKVSNKWQGGSHITRKAQPYGEAFRRWSQCPSMDLDSEVRRVRGDWPEFQAVEENAVFTVPKRFDTDRTAAKGTTWNNALQKGVGTMVRRRLQRCRDKLLLPDAQVYHGILAKLGSKTGCLVTGDLVGASDSVTVGHVLTFFPEDWCRPMLDVREEYGLMPPDASQQLVRWEKYGSMGNGSTFEVETALFYAIVKACCSSTSLVSVYGDDLIYPQEYHDAVVEAMSFCGFEFNREKTFSGSHPFRESCGAYFHNGVDVKPFYIEKPPRSIGEVIRLHNDVVVWHRSAEPDGPWAAVVEKCRALVPKRFWGPLGVTGTLWCEWDEATPRYRPGFQSWKILAVLQVVESIEDDAYLGRYLSSLWKGKAHDTGQLETVRARQRSRDRGLLTGYPLIDYVYGPDSDGGYTSRVTDRFRCVSVYVDRARWVRLSAQNIELMSRAYFERT